MSSPDPATYKRPYSLEKRSQASSLKKKAILAAARRLLESRGFFQLTMESLGRESGVSRQTVHTLFGSKARVLEALFDEIALAGGMEAMSSIMRGRNPQTAVEDFVRLFAGFWSRDRLLIRRIHGIAAIDPEFGHAVEARNQRRLQAASRVIGIVGWKPASKEAMSEAINSLHALTSF